MDKDGAGIIMFSMLETQLALHGFYDLEALQSIWKRVGSRSQCSLST
jgi:hypothetical protein